MYELYELANDIFDEEIFAGTDGNALLEEYNNIPDDDARSMLFDIVNEMQDAARDSTADVMRRIARSHKDAFVHEVRQKWACPDCSDQFNGVFVMLNRTPFGWTCPKCGSSTCEPEEDACYDMTDR